MVLPCPQWFFHALRVPDFERTLTPFLHPASLRHVDERGTALFPRANSLLRPSDPPRRCHSRFPEGLSHQSLHLGGHPHSCPDQSFLPPAPVTPVPVRLLRPPAQHASPGWVQVGISHVVLASGGEERSHKPLAEPVHVGQGRSAHARVPQGCHAVALSLLFPEGLCVSLRRLSLHRQLCPNSDWSPPPRSTIRRLAYCPPLAVASRTFASPSWRACLLWLRPSIPHGSCCVPV
jgi:hypothetical protein